MYLNLARETPAVPASSGAGCSRRPSCFSCRALSDFPLRHATLVLGILLLALRHRHSGNCRDLRTCTRRCGLWFGSRSDTAASTEDPPAAQAYPRGACETPPPPASAPYLLPRIVGSPRMPHRGASVRRGAGRHAVLPSLDGAQGRMGLCLAHLLPQNASVASAPRSCDSGCYRLAICLEGP